MDGSGQARFGVSYTAPTCGPSSFAVRPSPVQAFLISAVSLGLLVGFGIAAIVAVRSWWLDPEADHGDWESSLVGYKNLRDKGVLSEEEYRKISTLVEPYVRPDTKAPECQQRSVGTKEL
jgi:hypothetical protein